MRFLQTDSKLFGTLQIVQTCPKAGQLFLLSCFLVECPSLPQYPHFLSGGLPCPVRRLLSLCRYKLVALMDMGDGVLCLFFDVSRTSTQKSAKETQHSGYRATSHIYVFFPLELS